MTNNTSRTDSEIENVISICKDNLGEFDTENVVAEQDENTVSIKVFCPGFQQPIENKTLYIDTDGYAELYSYDV